MPDSQHDPDLPEKFPFDASFQKALVRLLCEDDAFAHSLGQFLKPTHFESDVLSWAFSYIQKHRGEFGISPSLNVLQNQIKGLDAKVRPIYDIGIQEIQTSDLKDEMWLRTKVLDFVRRNIFVQTFVECKGLYNTGKVSQAYDTMMERKIGRAHV